MNQNIITNFIKSAQEAGLTKEQAENFMSNNFGIQETASQSLSAHIDGILKSASVQKTAQSVAYTQGVLKAAVDAGWDIDKSTVIAQRALSQNATFKKVSTYTEKEDQNKIAYYTQGFMQASQKAGFTTGQSVDLLSHVGKQAGIQPPMPPSGMAGGMPPSGMAGGMPPVGGGMPPISNEEQELLQLIQSGQLPPELLQQLLAQLTAGQGGAPQGGGSGSEMFKNLPQ